MGNTCSCDPCHQKDRQQPDNQILYNEIEPLPSHRNQQDEVQNKKQDLTFVENQYIDDQNEDNTTEIDIFEPIDIQSNMPMTSKDVSVSQSDLLSPQKTQKIKQPQTQYIQQKLLIDTIKYIKENKNEYIILKYLLHFKIFKISTQLKQQLIQAKNTQEDQLSYYSLLQQIKSHYSYQYQISYDILNKIQKPNDQKQYKLIEMIKKNFELCQDQIELDPQIYKIFLDEAYQQAENNIEKLMILICMKVDSIFGDDFHRNFIGFQKLNDNQIQWDEFKKYINDLQEQQIIDLIDQLHNQ